MCVFVWEESISNIYSLSIYIYLLHQWGIWSWRFFSVVNLNQQEIKEYQIITNYMVYSNTMDNARNMNYLIHNELTSQLIWCFAFSSSCIKHIYAFFIIFTATISWSNFFYLSFWNFSVSDKVIVLSLNTGYLANCWLHWTFGSHMARITKTHNCNL